MVKPIKTGQAATTTTTPTPPKGWWWGGCQVCSATGEDRYNLIRITAEQAFLSCRLAGFFQSAFLDDCKLACNNDPLRAVFACNRGPPLTCVSVLPLGPAWTRSARFDTTILRSTERSKRLCGYSRCRGTGYGVKLLPAPNHNLKPAHDKVWIITLDRLV